MDILKQRFQEVASSVAQEAKDFLKSHGDQKIDQVTVSQVFGGMRGIKSMLWETSELDPEEGIRFRGYSIPKLRELLPKWKGGKEPLPEGLFWLMLTGEVPTQEQVAWLTAEWRRREQLPEQTIKVLDALAVDTHPMTQFVIGLMSMQPDSRFSAQYAAGMAKSEYWEYTYEDAMNLIGRLPLLAAYIYRRSFANGQHIAPDTRLDWSGNYAHMLGFDQPDFKSYMRLYLTIHADHEGGNASAHTTHLVGSTLSDPYLSFAGGMNALAGPLHGLANQEVIKWIFEMIDEIGTMQPTDDQVASYINQTLDGGKVIPGYGHAVLRQPDPRFIAQKVFAEEYLHESDIVKIVWQLFDIVPGILQDLGKVKNPWPNVDAHSGAILVHYGLKEYVYYTVMFGVSRALGVLAAQCWSRALGLPLERPKSLSFAAIKKMVH